MKPVQLARASIGIGSALCNLKLPKMSLQQPRVLVSCPDFGATISALSVALCGPKLIEPRAPYRLIGRSRSGIFRGTPRRVALPRTDAGIDALRQNCA